jgi:hypothetical protein
LSDVLIGSCQLEGTSVMSDKQFEPFYERVLIHERIAKNLPIPVVGKLLLSFFLACLFLVPYFLVLYEDKSEPAKIVEWKWEWEWLIGAIIFFAMSFLYYATHTFRNLFLLLDAHWKPINNQSNYIDHANEVLSDKKFLWIAALIGVFNLGMGWLFGMPKGIESILNLPIIISWGYFLVGAVCGLATAGIFGVIRVFTFLCQKGSFDLDYTAPDGCGGVRFLGDAIIKFSSVTLIVCVMISIYIINVEWKDGDDLLVKVFIWLWVIFPYLLSLLVAVAPAVGVNQLLRKYKSDEDCKLKEESRQLLNKINNLSKNSQLNELQGKYEHIGELRKKLYQMRTWPFGFSEYYQYSIVFISNIFLPIFSQLENLPHLLKKLLHLN